MSSIRIVDRVGSVAMTLAILALLLLFMPRLVRADSSVAADTPVPPVVAVMAGQQQEEHRHH